MSKKLIRLSHNLTMDTPTYGNRNKLVTKHTTCDVNGYFITESNWQFSTNHIGTHIDTQKHFIKDGISITDIDDTFWIFENVELIEITRETGKLIEWDDVSANIRKSQSLELLLIRTGYEKYRGEDKYWNDNPGISSNCANSLRKNLSSLRGIGFDFISLTSFNFRDDGKAAHKNILGGSKPFIIIEDMSLVKVNRKIVSLTVLPLFVENADASPVSVIAQME